MPAIEINCSQCGSEEYRIVDSRTGEVACNYCRNRWIIPELAQKSETEKFLEKQAERPQVIQDNSSETDRQLLNIFSSLFSGQIFAHLSRIARTILFIVAIIAVVIIAVLVFGLLNR